MRMCVREYYVAPLLIRVSRLTEDELFVLVAHVTLDENAPICIDSD